MGDSIRPGDRVRVHTEYEATVDWMDPYRYALVDDDGHDRNVSRIYRGTKVTKVEPPVETFKPGDRLRYKDIGFEVTLATEGYVLHHTAGRHDWIRYTPQQSFTSRHYEKVNI